MWKKIIIKTDSQIKNIRESWKYLTELLYILKNATKEWISLIELEIISEQYLQKNNLKGAFKWYNWFPANLCLSVNDCVVHGIPDDYILKSWDLLKIDCGVIYNKWISDSAISVVVGWDEKNQLWAELKNATKLALDNSLNYIIAWKPIFNFSKSVYTILKNNWFSVIENLTWHGVGVKVHEWPYIYNYPHPDTKRIRFQENMVICLEPITAVTSKDFVEKPWDSWSLYTLDWDLWAQREYMVLVKSDGCEVLSWIV